MKSIYERETAWYEKQNRMRKVRDEMKEICCARYGDCEKCPLQNTEFDPDKMSVFMGCRVYSMTLGKFYAFVTKKEDTK